MRNPPDWEVVGSTYLETEWVTCDDGTLLSDALHLLIDVPVPWVQALASWERADLSTHPRPARTGCGLTAEWITRPPAAARAGGAVRCPGCCALARYPDGWGSPVGDDRCVGQLIARLALSGLSLPVAIPRRTS